MEDLGQHGHSLSLFPSRQVYCRTPSEANLEKKPELLTKFLLRFGVILDVMKPAAEPQTQHLDKIRVV